MALPKSLQDIVDKKQDYIDKNRNRLESDVIKMQEAFLQRFIEEILPELETKDGLILNTTKNLKLIERLDQIYNDFNNTNQAKIVKSLGQSLLGMNKINQDYFNQITLNEVTKKRFDSVASNTDKLLSARIGVNDKGEIIKGSYLDSFITDNSLLTDLKQTVVKHITGGQPITEFRKVIKDKIIGNKDVTGGFEKYYRTFAYDTYQQYDRAYGNQMAAEFKMDYALYQGGLINDSRDFCRDHENHVYTRDEIKEFGNWTYEKAKNIDTFNDPGSQTGIPSYIKSNKNYDPFTDLGSYNCRHQLSWITKQAAERLRPELKGKVIEEKPVVKEVKQPVATPKTKPISEETIKSVNKQEKVSSNFKSFNSKEAQKYYEANQSDMSDFDDYKAIADYKFRGYEGMNAGLRGGDKKKLKEYNKQIDTLSKYIDKNRIKDDIVLHRKVRTNFFKDIKAGDVINDPGFSSASLKKDFDKNGFFGENTIEIRCPKGSSVASLNESNLLEFCIDKGVKYKVIESKGNNLIIELLK